MVLRCMKKKVMFKKHIFVFQTMEEQVTTENISNCLQFSGKHSVANVKDGIVNVFHI